MFKKQRRHDTVSHSTLHSGSIFFAILCLTIALFSVQKIKTFNFSNSPFSLNYKKIFNLSEEKSELSGINLNSSSTKSHFNKNVFRDLNIIGKSYVVYDVNAREIVVGKNELQILPLASLTKIPAAMTMYHISSSTRDIVIKKSLMGKDEILDIGLSENQKWQMSELLKFALVYSSNAAMDIIANTISRKNKDFITEMNSYVSSFGYESFTFTTATGLDYGDEIGGKGNALEYAKLFARSYEIMPEILTYTTNTKINVESEKKKIYSVPNTNKAASNIVGLLASKTGYTDAAGGNLAIMFDLGLDQKVVIVVLGSTLEGRFKDVAALYNATKDSLVNIK